MLCRQVDGDNNNAEVLLPGRKQYFGGLDTCNHTEFGRFEKYFKLRNEVENRAISNCYDINTHLDTLCKHEIISREMVNNMRSSAHNFALRTDFKKYFRGASYVLFHAAMTFQEDNRDRTIAIAHSNSDGNEDQNTKVKII
jgi:hypothetical protein